MTVDRAHVLATGSMDRHGAYVALSRHRESVSVHWARDDVGSREGLVAKLSRERLKDTTLDYGRDRTLNGDLDRDQDRDRRVEEPGRGMFEGLDLSVRGRGRAVEKEASVEAGKEKGGVERDVPVSPFVGLRLPRVQRDPVPVGLGGFVPGGDPLPQAVERYARAWVDAERMVAQELPVLEHQKKALHEAARDLEQVRRGAVADLAAALKHEPEIRQAMHALEGPARARKLVEGLEHEDKLRRSPELRAARFVKAWDGLDRAQQAVALKALKRDAQMDSLVREKSRELGIQKGSSLDHGLHQPQRDLERGLSRSRSRGMDMGM